MDVQAASHAGTDPQLVSSKPSALTALPSAIGLTLTSELVLQIVDGLSPVQGN